MVRILILILAFVAFFISLFAIKDETISKKFKTIISSIIIVFASMAYFYESSFDDKSAKQMKLLNDFQQGKVLNCGDLNVSKEKFNFEFGTSCFVAKREFVKISGTIIPISKCLYEK